MIAALALYERALLGSGGAQVQFEDGTQMPLPVRRYLNVADAADRSLLAGVDGPVLDVGCGPGRHLRALAALGVEALGVDVSPVAVDIACRGGGRAVVADVFGDVPDPGSWETALLLDGNIGIGGHPTRLLRRLATLLAPGGTVLAELEPPDATCHMARARLASAGEASGWFPWARVSVTDVGELATGAEMIVERRWRCNDRWFARLRSTAG